MRLIHPQSPQTTSLLEIYKTNSEQGRRKKLKKKSTFSRKNFFLVLEFFYDLPGIAQKRDTRRQIFKEKNER